MQLWPQVRRSPGAARALFFETMPLHLTKVQAMINDSESPLASMSPYDLARVFDPNVLATTLTSQEVKVFLEPRLKKTDNVLSSRPFGSSLRMAPFGPPLSVYRGSSSSLSYRRGIGASMASWPFSATRPPPRRPLLRPQGRHLRRRHPDPTGGQPRRLQDYSLEESSAQDPF